MQSWQALSDPLHGISIPNSSSVLILLWLFLHLHLPLFFSTSLWRLLMDLTWLMLNKHKRWFHSSRVKFISVSMSASWFLVSMYLIWIFGVHIDSIEQPIESNSVGFEKHVSLSDDFVPLWSSWYLLRCPQRCTTMLLYEKNSRLRTKQHCLDHQSYHEFSFAFEICTGLSVLDHADACSREELRRSDPINQVPDIPSNLNPAVQRDNFRFCWTVRILKFVSWHIQLIGTNVWLPKMHNVPPEVDFESSRSPAKSESWNSPSLHCLAELPI